MAEHGIEPPDQRTVADEWNEPLGLIGPPLLVTEEEKHDHHRCADHMVVEILGELATSNISLSAAISTEMRALRCSTTRMIGLRVDDA
jgi:hypothetical protein